MLADGGDDQLLRESAQLIIASLGLPFRIDGHRLSVAPGTGAVNHPTDSTDSTDAALLLRRADAAMCAAKAQGRNCLVIYTPTQDPPAEFILIGEQIGMRPLVGRHALHAAARIADEVRAPGSDASVSVNPSPRQLLRPELKRTVLQACQHNRTDPSMIELEMTESALITNLGRGRVAEGVKTEARFALPRAMGVDDYQGTVFSRPQCQTQWIAKRRLALTC